MDIFFISLIKGDSFLTLSLPRALDRLKSIKSLLGVKGLIVINSHCAVPENIHIHPKEDSHKLQEGGVFQKLKCSN